MLESVHEDRQQAVSQEHLADSVIQASEASSFKTQPKQQVFAQLKERRSTSGKSQKFALPKMVVTEEDRKFLKNTREVIERAADFKKMAVSVSIDESALDDEEDDTFYMISVFLNQLDRVMQVKNATEKHQIEVEAIDEITRDIPDIFGEKCRDFIKHFSNLKKNFREVTKTSQQLQSKVEGWFDSIKQTQKEQNRLLEAEKYRADKLQALANVRNGEIKVLKTQIQNLIDVLNRKERQQSQSDMLLQKSQLVLIEGRESSSSIIEVSERLIDEVHQSQSASESLKDLLPKLESLKGQIVDLVKLTNEQRQEAQNKADLAETYIKNCKYLEDKISELLTEKEEQSVHLKSQVIIFKQKAKGYKTKLQVELEDFKKNSLFNEKNNAQKEIQKQTVELNELKNKLHVELKNNQELQTRIDKTIAMFKQQEEELRDQLDAKETNIQSLTEQLDQISRTHQLRLTNEGVKLGEISDKVAIAHQEQVIKELRIDFLLNNQKKQVLQKKFLEQQLEKDVQQLQLVMNKTELELKKDQLISSSLALSRLQMLHKTMSDSLKYMRKIVSFMVFDQDINNQKEYTSLDDEKSIAQLERDASFDQDMTSDQDSQSASGANPVEITVDNFQANYNHEPGAPIPIDRLVKLHQFELLDILLHWTQESFNVSKTPISPDLSHAISIVQTKADPIKTADIKRTFLAESRIHHAQHVFKLNEKVSALEAERQHLHAQLHQQQLHISDISAMQERIRLESPSQAPRSPERVPKIQGFIAVQNQTYVKDDFIEDDRTLTDVTMLQQENAALKARIKEVRIAFNKQINELQETLKMTRSSLENDMTQLKIRYGKDLSKLQTDYEKNANTLRAQIEQETREELEDYKLRSEHQIADLRFKSNEERNKLQQQIEIEQSTKEEYFLELQKLKQESSYLYQGGFGTFSLAFENPVFPKLVDKQKELEAHRQNMDVFRQSVKGGIKKKRNKLIWLKFEEQEAELSSEISQLESQIESVEIQPLEKLCHFIEVGFQIAQKNFQALQVYNELTYDSMARKYLFEFQMPLRDNDVLRLEKKLRDQIAENFALFNEISPVYISLNLGRPVNQMSHDCIDIDKFRMIGRQALQVNSHYLTVNFLKCDLPMRMMRIIAFNSQTCQHFQIDLTTEDLMILTEGHLKLMEEESNKDLITLLLNSLTLIKRKVKVASTVLPGNKENINAKPQFQMVEVLVLEHRCFFNEMVRTNWDNKKKKILMRHDRRLQGIVKDVETTTDFDKALCYEAFSVVYAQDFFLPLQPQDLADHFSMELRRGDCSGNLMLELKQSNASLVQTLCLFNSQLQEEGKTNNLASALIQPKRSEEDVQDPTLALCYVVSLERIFGREEIVIVRVTSVQRKFAAIMDKFEWNGEGAPYESATSFSSEIFYLVRKVGTPFEYYRAKDFEILNTEARAQLFSHSFGYQQKQADFGVRLDTPLSEPEPESIMTQHSQDQNADEGEQPEESSPEKPNTPIREEIGARQNQLMTLKVPNKFVPFKGNENLIIRQFVIIRMKSLHENEKHVMEAHYESHFALVSLFATPSQLDEGKLKVHVNLCQLNHQLEQILDVSDIIPEIDDRRAICADKKNELSDLLLEHLIIQTLQNGHQIVYFDRAILGISQELQQLRTKRFDELMVKSSSEQFKLQFPDPTALKLSKPELLDCIKQQEMAVIGQRQFKVTCYFVKNLKNIQVSGCQHFAWKVLYIDAYYQQKDQTFTIVLTESDIAMLVNMLKEVSEYQNHGEHSIDIERVFNPKMATSDIIQLALDLITFDKRSDCLKVSFDNFKLRVKERRKLESLFLETGGSYLRKTAETTIDEFAGFETSVPKTELSKKLIISSEKDFSDSKVDIKVYLIKLRSLPDLQKIQFEVFSLEEPNLIFKCDYLSSSQQAGHQVLIERFNLLEQDISESRKQLTSEAEAEVRNRGLVLSVSEQSFPHEFNFMLLEPCSHIFWSYQHSDDMLNQMERRRDKHAFAYLLLKSCSDKDGIMRQLGHKSTKLIDPGYCINEKQSEEKERFLVAHNEGIEAMTQEDLTLIFGKTVQIKEGVYREVRVYLSKQARKLVLCSAQVENIPAQQVKSSRDAEQQYPYERTEIEVHLLLATQKESSRYYQGVLVGGQNPLIYQVEQAVGISRERAIRVNVKKILTEESFDSLIDVTISDPSLFTTVPQGPGQKKRYDTILLPDFEPKEEKKFALNTGYRDTLGCLPKMEDIATDIANCEADKLSAIQKLETQKRQQDWDMIYRTIKRDNEEQQFVIQALGQKTPEEDNMQTNSIDEFNIRKPQSNRPSQAILNKPQPQTYQKIKISLFEMNSGAAEEFQFTPSEILSAEELKQVVAKPDFAKSLYKKAIDLRLRVKELEAERVGFNAEERKYVIFFVSPALLATEIVQEKTLFSEIDNFDIRKGTSERLFKKPDQKENVQPELKLTGQAFRKDSEFEAPTQAVKMKGKLYRQGLLPEKRVLIAQFEKNDRIYDVHQELNPFQVVLKINTYDKETFKLLKAASVCEQELVDELQADSQRHLLEAQNRQELARQLVENLCMAQL